ncbi:kinase activity protein [[Candida] boidinii]|nr:kinase activity protein [[Candida] boidinii]
MSENNNHQNTASLNRKRPLVAIHTNSSKDEENDTRLSKKVNFSKPVAVLVSLDPNTIPHIELPRKASSKIGRSKKCDIVLKSLDISTVHCEIGASRIENNGVFMDVIFLKDSSSNGTFINGQLVGKGNSCLVRSGDKVSFAASSHFVLRYNSDLNSEDEQFFNGKNGLKSQSNGSNSNRSFFKEYVLGDLLGTGHYAQVKNATRRTTGQICAVKIFHPTKATNSLRINPDENTEQLNINEPNNNNNNPNNNFNRELNILMKLDHPNIVKFYDAFLEPVNQHSVTTYLVLEKINGGELFNRIVDKRKLRQNETKALIKQLLDGLNYLHCMEIAHRDLKPENILLEITPKTKLNSIQKGPWDDHELDIKVKIADFGLAKFIGELSYTNTLCGTPAYVAPEVLVGGDQRKYNKSVDMWSVGVLLYVCLCGFPPFSDELGPPSMRQQIIDGRYAFYSPYWDEISDEALDLIARLLVVDSTKRLNCLEALSHFWFKNLQDFNDNEDKMNRELTRNELYNFKDDKDITYQDMRARAMSVRIPTRGNSNPVYLTDRALTTSFQDTNNSRDRSIQNSENANLFNFDTPNSNTNSNSNTQNNKSQNPDSLLFPFSQDIPESIPDLIQDIDMAF